MELLKNFDLYKTSARAYEHHDRTDGPSEEEEARAAEEVERQIDEWIERRYGEDA